nr:hypothetical protein [Tanacetum cinerariifolium]
MLFHYKLALSQVEARLAEHRNQEVKYCEKIRVLEFKVESRADCIESLTKELELIKKEKDGLDSKLAGLPEFTDDTITDYSRPSLAIESTSNDLQNKITSVTETEASDSTISSKPFIKFVKAAVRPTKNKIDKGEIVKKPAVKYAELYRKPSKGSKVRGNQRNWNNLKSQQLGHLRDKIRRFSEDKKKQRFKKSTKVVDYILQVKKKLLTKKLEDSEVEHQV